MKPGFYAKIYSLHLALLFSPALLATDPIWIDVRSADEYRGGHVSEAVNIPHTEIAGSIAEITGDKNAVIYVYCRSGRRSGVAKATLEDLGFTQVVNLGSVEKAKKKHSADSIPKGGL